MKLLVISNHPPEKWVDEQKRGWDEIKFIPFPNVPAEASREEVKEMGEKLLSEICQLTGWHISASGVDTPETEWRLSIQGESTLTFLVLCHFRTKEELVIFPTTERVVEEKEGGVKISTFKFVRWR